MADMDLRDGSDSQLTLDESEGGCYTLGSYATQVVSTLNSAASSFLGSTTFPYTYTPQRLEDPSFPGDPNLASTRADEAAIAAATSQAAAGATTDQTVSTDAAAAATTTTTVATTGAMPSEALGMPSVSDGLYKGFSQIDVVDAGLYEKYDVKRGLRNADGSGVLVGLTTISNVHGYSKIDGKTVPDEGDLIYRGYHIADLVNASQDEGRFGYEEVAYLLISGRLPTQVELDDFCARIDSRKQLPEGYLSIFPRTTYSHSIMAKSTQRMTMVMVTTMVWLSPMRA